MIVKNGLGFRTIRRSGDGLERSGSRVPGSRASGPSPEWASHAGRGGSPPRMRRPYGTQSWARPNPWLTPCICSAPAAPTPAGSQRIARSRGSDPWVRACEWCRPRRSRRGARGTPAVRSVPPIRPGRGREARGPRERRAGIARRTGGPTARKKPPECRYTDTGGTPALLDGTAWIRRAKRLHMLARGVRRDAERGRRDAGAPRQTGRTGARLWAAPTSALRRGP